MTVLQLPQGHMHTPREFDGLTLSEATARLAAWDADFLEKFPQCRPFHRPSWQVRDVAEGAQAPWGHEWYATDGEGRLFLHSADYDSSG